MIEWKPIAEYVHNSKVVLVVDNSEWAASPPEPAVKRRGEWISIIDQKRILTPTHFADYDLPEFDPSISNEAAALMGERRNLIE